MGPPADDAVPPPTVRPLDSPRISEDRGAIVPPTPSPVRETPAGVRPAGVATLARSRRVPPTARGALALALLVAVFLARPIAHVRTHHFLAADITQNQSLTNLVPGHRSGNQLISDPVVEMVPWLLFNRAELAAGRVPLWNPYNACGIPHLASYQSAVFSPFSLPFYVFSLKWALLLTAGLKLYLLGLFTYLFLLRLRVGHLPALLGAVAFQFSANNVLLLSYPHSGVMVTLPAAMYFTEVAFARLERSAGGGRPRIWGPVAGVGVTLALGLIAGHPEPFYFCAWMAAAYAVFRLGHLAVREPRLRWRPLAGLAVGLLAANALAALSAAWQVAPFLEYLGRSEMLTLRNHRQTPLEGGLWVMHLFPDFMGTPVSPHYTRWSFPPPNYEAANSVYIGGVVLLMGALALLFLRRDRRFLFFGLAALLWPFYAYDLLGALSLAARIPTLDLAPVNRSQGLWHFALAVCAALLVDAAARGTVRARTALAAATVAVGGAALGITLWRVAQWGPKAAASLEFSPELVAHVAASQRFLTLTFAAGAVALAALWVVRGARARVGLVVTLIAVVFLQCGFHLRDYNPISRDDLVYPHTVRMHTLQQESAGQRLAIFGEDTLPPHTNLRYGLEILASYDAMGIHLFEQLHGELFGAAGNWRIASIASERALAMFGVRWTLTHQDVSTGAARRARALYRDGPASTSAEILPESPLEQVFTAPENGLCSVAVRLDDLGRANTCELRLTLIEDGRVEPIATRGFACGEIAFMPDQRYRLVLSFPAIADSAGRTYRLALTSGDARPGNAVRAWLSGLAGHEELAHIGALAQGGAPLEQILMLELCDEGDPFQPVARLGPHTLYRFGGASGKVFAVGQAVAARDPDEAWRGAVEPRLDPRKTVVLGPEAFGPPWDGKASRSGGPSPVEILEERPGLWRVSAPRADPGWLVFTQSFYPGWRARVGGRERPVVQANHAFTAVPLEPGENLVELRYDPDSFRVGVWISAAAVATGALVLALALRRAAAPA
jgi:hypothetical protein